CRGPGMSLSLSMTPERRAPARQATLQWDRAERELGAPAASWPRSPVCRRGILLTSAPTWEGGPTRRFGLDAQQRRSSASLPWFMIWPADKTLTFLGLTLRPRRLITQAWH